jgi:hypothetical protein
VSAVIKKLTLASALLASSPAIAMDSNNRFAVFGVGTIPCFKLPAIPKKRLELIASWANGYFTAAGIASAGVYDASYGASIDTIMAAVKAYCEKSPTNTIGDAVMTVQTTLERLEKDRSVR